MKKILFQGDSITDSERDRNSETDLGKGYANLVASKLGFENPLKYKFIPLQEKFDKATELAKAEYWSIDGIHPTCAGHELIKREWIKAFEEYIKE